jgi:hypothetical protein
MSMGHNEYEKLELLDGQSEAGVDLALPNTDLSVRSISASLGLGSEAPTVYTQTYSTAATTVPAATQLTPPAGGTGATAGAYDTAANRDLMIASITAGAADLLALKKVVNALIDDLQAAKIIA